MKTLFKFAAPVICESVFLALSAQMKQVRSFNLPAFLPLVAAAALCFFLLGCGSPPQPVDHASRPAKLWKDDLGREVSIPLDVRRVVSLAPNLTEIIYAVGAGDKLVGDTTYCDFPEAARSVQKVGDTMSPNMETIIALHPDIVFVSTASQIEAFMRTLADNGIVVYVVDARSVEDVLTDIQRVGDILGSHETATNEVENLRSRLDQVRTRVENLPKRRVFVQISNEPLFTAGKDAYLTQVVDIAGGESVTRDLSGAFPNISRETALKLDPEVVVLSDNEGNHEPNSAFAKSAAVKNSEVFRINADLLSRPGPRIVDAIEILAEKIHPKQASEPKKE